MKRLIVVRQTCQHMATKMGDLPEETVEIGGLVPRFFTDQENLPVGLRPHLGTVNPDPVPELVALNREIYRGLSARLWGTGFEPDVNDQGARRSQAGTTRTPHTVTGTS